MYVKYLNASLIIMSSGFPQSGQSISGQASPRVTGEQFSVSQLKMSSNVPFSLY